MNEQQKRVARGQALFTVYVEMAETDDEAADLIADVLHWSYQAHDAGGEPEVTRRIWEQAWEHFWEEIQESDPEPRACRALQAALGEKVVWRQMMGGGVWATTIAVRYDTSGGGAVAPENATRYLLLTWDGAWQLGLYDAASWDQLPELYDGLMLDTRGIAEHDVDRIVLKVQEAVKAFA